MSATDHAVIDDEQFTMCLTGDLDLDLELVFQDYEQESFQQLSATIQGQKQLPEGVFGLLLKKIYKRSK